MRSNARIADAAAALILAGIGVLVSMALAAALGFVLDTGVRRGDADAQRIALLIVFWMMAFFAVGLPVIFGVAQHGVPLERLVQYPLSRAGLYRLSLAGSLASRAHVFWYPILLASTVVAIVLNRLPATVWLAVSLAFSACLVAWCHTVQLFVQRVLRRRRMKELAALIGLVLLVLASMVPAFIDSRHGDAPPVSATILTSLSSVVVRAASTLPPSIAVVGVTASVAGDLRDTVASVGWLVAWTGTGLAVGFVLFGRIMAGGGGGPVVKREATTTSRRPRLFTVDGWGWVPAPSRAVAARDLLYLLRSTVGRFNIVIMPVFVVIMGLVVVRDVTGPVLGVDRASMVFLGAMVYASMFSNNFLYNAYAWEGAGIRSYFTTPVTTRQVVFGKNLGLWSYNLILAVECFVCYAAVVGLPHLSVAISGCLAFAAGVLGSTIAGNFVSPALPVARDISKIGSSPSQIGVLVSFGVLIANVILIGGLVVMAELAPSPWVQPLLLMILVGLEVAAYRILLGPAARLLEERRESLVEAVQAPT
jgi:hypothetical protein